MNSGASFLTHGGGTKSCLWVPHSGLDLGGAGCTARGRAGEFRRESSAPVARLAWCGSRGGLTAAISVTLTLARRLHRGRFVKRRRRLHVTSTEGKSGRRVGGSGLQGGKGSLEVNGLDSTGGLEAVRTLEADSSASQWIAVQPAADSSLEVDGDLEATSALQADNREVSSGAGSFLNSTTASLLLVVLAALYGGNVPLLKLVENEAPLDVTAPEVLTLRFITACVLVLPWILANLKKSAAVLLPGLELGFWLWLGYTLQILGLEKTSASTAAISTAVVGVTVQALEVLVDKQPLRPVVMASSVGVIGGLALFTTAPGAAAVSQVSQPLLINRVLGFLRTLAPQPKPLPHELLLANVPGEALALLGAAIFGVHVWRCNRIINAAQREGKEIELELATVQVVVTTLLCFGLSTLDSPYPLGEQLLAVERLRTETWLQIAACGVLCTGLPSLLELFAFKVVDPAIASLIYCTIPLWGTLLGVVFLKDALGPQSMAGGLLIFLAALAPSITDMMSGKAREDEAAD
eukprot:CAMPEP_0171109480 /NCGR_PEP_ID=MMETSP0766_2-20121228/70800_1 /TAXON_ID=439317 /ORGANISM="Gambierdiscus australes, Strain CAWD 149" /LENGTH=521 /DNA_ID=CAMNT_0011571219 /DNA_START=16 /DNA_END=1581 /DNA_ORIENTATION=-